MRSATRLYRLHPAHGRWRKRPIATRLPPLFAVGPATLLAQELSRVAATKCQSARNSNSSVVSFRQAGGDCGNVFSNFDGLSVKNSSSGMHLALKMRSCTKIAGCMACTHGPGAGLFIATGEKTTLECCELVAAFERWPSGGEQSRRY